MPWSPELFSAPALERVKEQRRREHLITVPYFDGMMAGETDALIASFAGEPEVHHPIRGRVKGERAFRDYVDDTIDWLEARNATVREDGHTVTEAGGVEEVVVHLDGDDGRIVLPIAIVAERGAGARLAELRVYYSYRALTGRHKNRTPVMQPDPDARPQDVVAEHQRALAAGDVDAVVATFERNGCAREPAGGPETHRGHDALRAFYTRVFSNGGGVPVQHCAVLDDGRTCALEYNLLRWGRTDVPPEGAVVVYERGDSGKLAAVRIYEDADPPRP
jgi:SnoaL-like protein